MSVDSSRILRLPRFSATRFLGLVLVLVVAASGCGAPTGFLVNVEVDPRYVPGRDFDHIRLQVSPGSASETTSESIEVEEGMEGPYTFLVLQGDTRRYNASVKVLISNDTVLLPWGERSEAGWVFEPDQIVEKNIRFDAPLE